MLEKTKIYRSDGHREAPADKYSTAFYSDIWLQKERWKSLFSYSYYVSNQQHQDRCEKKKINMTPRKRKLKARILSLRSQLWKVKKKRNNVDYKHTNDKLKHILYQLRDLISAKSLIFIESQNVNSQEKWT